VNGYFNYFFFYRKDRHTWDNNIDVNLGYIQSTSIGSRKNDDRFDYLSKYGYKMDTTGRWYLSTLFNFRSQFFDGYTFSNNVGDFSSSFLSPAYVILSIGFDHKPALNYLFSFHRLLRVQPLWPIKNWRKKECMGYRRVNMH
jgi:hypothetical protein